MEVRTAFEQLLHVAFDLRYREMNVRILKQAGKVVVHVRCHHEHAWLLARVLRSLDSHLFQFQDIDVVQLLQQLDLSERSDWEAILLIVHQNLLQRHNLSCSL